MAITSADLQAQLGTHPLDPQVLRAFEPSQGTQQHWLVRGGAVHKGRTRLINTTAADNAATQAAAVLTALAAT
jgi:hypothetical protein